MMDNELPKRKPNRLKHYDYSHPGAYFITICTHNRREILSNVVGAIHESPEIQLLPSGSVVDEIINNLPAHLCVRVDAYVIMPDHIHLIIGIIDSEMIRRLRAGSDSARSIVSRTVGYIKMNSSKRIHQILGDEKVWQRSFYDHVIRNCDDYEDTRRYIYENPLRWQYKRLKQKDK